MAGGASARLDKRDEAKALTSEAIKILEVVLNHPKPTALSECMPLKSWKSPTSNSLP